MRGAPEATSARTAALWMAVGATFVSLAGAEAVAAKGSPEPHRAAARCDDAQGRTLLANRQVRVLRRVTTERGARTFACHRRSGRLTWLGDEDVVTTSTDIGLLRLGGQFVAFVVAGGGRESADGVGLRRLDARTGRFKTVDPGFVPSGSAGVLDDLPSFLVTTRGQLAWIARTSLEPRQHAVRALRGGEVVTLEERGDVDPSSLAAAGERIYWTSGSQPRSG